MPNEAMNDPATLATEDYLRRLDEAAVRRGLSTRDRDELRSRTAEWVADRRAEAVLEGEEPLGAVLDTIVGLGPPEHLLEEAQASGLGSHARGAVRLTLSERIAVFGLAFGWATGGISWVVGVIALVRCARWRLTEKLSAALLTLLVPPIAVGVATAGNSMLLTGLGFIAVMCVALAGPVGLVRQLRRRGGMPV